MTQQSYINNNDHSQENRIPSSALVKDQGRVIITHNGEEYTLRVTRNGKLILNK